MATKTLRFVGSKNHFTKWKHNAVQTIYKFDTEHKVIIDASGPYIENKIINATQIRPFNLKELYDLMKNVLQLRGVTDEIPEYVEGKMFSFIPRKV